MTVEEALHWVAELFEEPIEKIKPSTLKEEIEAWDSLGVLTLMAKLDELNIQLKEKDLENLKSVEDILLLMKRHGHLSEYIPSTPNRLNSGNH